MLTANDVGWSKYSKYEGPWYRGSCFYKLPEKATTLEKYVSVVASCEGGYDSINMYDSQVISIGIIQFAGHKKVAMLLGKVIEECGEGAVFDHIGMLLKDASAELKKVNGTWSFYVGSVKVTQEYDARALFASGCGKIGTWTRNSTAGLRARAWAAGFANVFSDERARKVQRNLVCDQLMSYVFHDASLTLFSGADQSDPLVCAMQAAYLNFAINSPARANDVIKNRLKEIDSRHKVWSHSWCVALLQELVFNSGIDLWKHRYDTFRPVIESLWGVKFPENHVKLKNWIPAREVIHSITSFFKSIFSFTR